MSELSVATANTHEARMLQNPDGLKPFVERGIGALLLQEVLGVERGEVEDRIGADGYDLLAMDPGMGLAIAIESNSGLRQVDGPDATLLQPPSKLGGFLRPFNQSHRLRARGILGVHIGVDGIEGSVTLATTHPIVFVRAAARKRQIMAMGETLLQPFYNTPQLIVGGDMNHYPGPREVDLSMQQSLGMKRAVLSAPSWKIEGSRHEWLARIGSLATRRPIGDFDAELDAMLYRGVRPETTEVFEIASDHRAVATKFQLG